MADRREEDSVGSGGGQGAGGQEEGGDVGGLVEVGKRDGGDQLRALAPYICTDLRIYISGGIQTQRSAMTCKRTINILKGVMLSFEIQAFDKSFH